MSEEKANQRVEEFKREMKTLSVKLKEAEQRAENAEKQVKRLQKEVDRLEGMFSPTTNIYLPIECAKSMREHLSINQSYRCTLCAIYDTYRALHCSFN